MAGLEEFVLADLARAQRLIRRTGVELDPQFRIASPEGDWALAITLSADEKERQRQFGLVARFMAWKSCLGFTHAVELMEPDALVCIGVTHKGVYGVISMIERKPLSFAEPFALSREQIGDEVPALLPCGAISLSDGEIEELRAYFGAGGTFPAVHVPTGRIGLD